MRPARAAMQHGRKFLRLQLRAILGHFAFSRLQPSQIGLRVKQIPSLRLLAEGST